MRNTFLTFTGTNGGSNSSSSSSSSSRSNERIRDVNIIFISGSSNLNFIISTCRSIAIFIGEYMWYSCKTIHIAYCTTEK